MKLAIIGSGYVGLVSGACMADFGHQVVCIDNDKSKVASIEAGRMPFFEPTSFFWQSGLRRGAATATPILPTSTPRRVTLAAPRTSPWW